MDGAAARQFEDAHAFLPVAGAPGARGALVRAGRDRPDGRDGGRERRHGARGERREKIANQALLLRGLAAVSRGELDVAEAILPERLAFFREEEDPWSVSVALSGLVQVALARGDTEEATSLIGEYEAVSRAAGDWTHLSLSLNLKALLARLRGDDARADAPLRESVRLAASLRDAWSVAYGVIGLAGVAAGRGQAERAVRLFGALESLRERMGVAAPWGAWQPLGERDLATAREELNPDTFDAARAEGRAMTLEEAVAEALVEEA